MKILTVILPSKNWSPQFSVQPMSQTKLVSKRVRVLPDIGNPRSFDYFLPKLPVNPWLNLQWQYLIILIICIVAVSNRRFENIYHLGESIEIVICCETSFYCMETCLIDCYHVECFGCLNELMFSSSGMLRNRKNKTRAVTAVVDQLEQLALFRLAQIRSDTVLLHPVQIVIINKAHKSAGACKIMAPGVHIKK